MQKQPHICKQFDEIRKRQCKFTAIRGSDYCAYHQKDNERFIPCPVDPSHTVDKNRIQKHIKICNKIKMAEKLQSNIWFCNEINGKKVKPSEQQIQKLSLQQLQEQQPTIYNGILDKIKKCFQQAVQIYYESIQLSEQKPFFHLSNYSVEDLSNYLLNKDHLSPEVEKATKQLMGLDETVQTSYSAKHTYQVGKLMEILGQNKLLSEDLIYVEFGAGKGLLSSEIAGKFKGKQSKHILLEIEGRQNKCDKLHRDNPFYLRFRTDILDFNMNKIPDILEEKGLQTDKTQNLNIVGISKHMCGYATDISVKALVNCKDECRCHFKGMMIATCCHHKINQENYLNLQFLFDLGFTSQEIQYLFNFSSWAICNFRNEKDIENDQSLSESGSEEEEKEDEEDQEKNCQATKDKTQDDQTKQIKNYQEKLDKEEEKSKVIEKQNIDKQQNQENNLTTEKEELGTMVKRMLDIGRVMYFRQKGIQSYLQKYCSPKFSPENFVIMVNQK